MEFVSKYPLAHDDIGARQARYQVLGVVGDQDGVLLLHRVMPNRVGESTIGG
jgi:hypothetical protein